MPFSTRHPSAEPHSMRPTRSKFQTSQAIDALILRANIDPDSDIGQLLCVFESKHSLASARQQFLETLTLTDADPDTRSQHQRIADNFSDMVFECLSRGTLDAL